MNARLYDPVVGRFLSPDPYIQAPDFSQNFNRYSYALNNPLRYTDPSGELAWFIPVITGLVGGFVNMAATWNSADGFWQHFAAFGVGAAAGVAAPFTGGSSYWTVAGVATASGATVAASNSVIAQTGTNFSGMGNVNWGQVGISAGVGGVSSFAGGSAGYWASKASFVVNGISSPALRSAVVSPISSAAGHVAGGTTAGLIQGQSLGDAFYNSFDGIGTNMAMGTVIGMATTTGVSLANGVNPINGNNISTKNSNNASVHAGERSIERNVSENAINDALSKPLKVTDVKYDGQGRPSVKYIGTDATVVVNTETGKIITVYPTSTNRAIKLGGKK